MATPPHSAAAGSLPPTPSSPLAKTVRGTQQFSSVIKLATELHQEFAAEMEGYWIGPADPTEFLDTFMPLDPKLELPDEVSRISFSSMPQNVSHESKMYEPFMKIVQPILPKGFRMNNTSTRAPDGTKQKPDVGLVDDSADPVQWTWASLHVSVEMKPSESQDAFTDDVNSLSFMENLNNQQQSCIRGQLSSYTAVQLSHQHRTFLFSVFICGNYARFIRWDPSGAIVTRRFNYLDEPVLLAQFFFRYTTLSVIQRGLDPTAHLATPYERQSFEDAIREYIEDHDTRQTHHMLEYVSSNYSCYTLEAVDSRRKDGSKPRCYIVNRPMAYTPSARGRCRRGYVALDKSSGELVFLKDYWRFAGDDRHSEAEIYAELAEASVPHLPPVQVAGDIPPETGGAFQTTLTPSWEQEKTAANAIFMTDDIKEYTHIRVVENLALPLTFVESSKKLVLAIANAVECILSAHTNRWLHRDVSPENIMLDENGNGFLNDWDHGTRVVEGREELTARSGNCQFISVALANNRFKPHHVIDDLESCFWVLFFIALHHFLSNATRKYVTVFDLSTSATDDAVINGSEDRHFLIANKITLLQFTSDPLDYVVKELAECFSNYYRVSPADKDSLRDTIGPTMLDLLKNALSRSDWPDKDAVEDLFPPQYKSQLDKQARNDRQAAVRARKLSRSGIHSEPQHALPSPSQLSTSSSARLGKRPRTMPAPIAAATTADEQRPNTKKAKTSKPKAKSTKGRKGTAGKKAT